MLSIETTDHWHDTFSGGHVGVLLVGNVDNTPRMTALEDRKRDLETRLRERFASQSRAELLELEVLKAYRAYYKRFDQTYHVQLQLESVVHKGKSLSRISPLVDASFLAELDTLLLTASHDADRLEGALCIDATRGGESFTQMNGSVRALKPNDAMMSDARGIVCTILYGQDERTPITSSTRRALFVTYAPKGIEAALVRQQLNLILEHVRSFAPECTPETLELYKA